MMPVIRINDATFASLSTLRTWFGTKTPSDTVDRIVREEMERLGIAGDDEPLDDVPVQNAPIMQFDSAPGLAFTKPLTAKVNGKALDNPKWSSILLAMIEQLGAKGLQGDKLAEALGIPARNGCFEEEGFRFLREVGISVQGQSAPDAWKEIDRIARKWRIPVVVDFAWRQNPKAQHPGRKGSLLSGQ